jgi:lipoyl(octanoyl) transferase
MPSLTVPGETPIRIRILRDLDYDRGTALQQEAVASLKADPGAIETLFLVEHRPVITLGRSGDGSNLVVAAEELERLGIAYREIGRGGDITYHGPGQWTVYPILRLENFCKDLHRYMRMLEEVTILFLARYGISGIRVGGKTGVWIGGDPKPVKLAAVGVAVSRWISFHGTAVNISPDLDAFRKLMTPCGISSSEGGVTSLADLLNRNCDMEEAARNWVECFCGVFPYAAGGKG